MLRTITALLAALALIAIAGCDGGSDSETTITAPDVPGGADSADVEVIRGWVDALRGGDVEAASDFFAIPSTAENGPVVMELDTRAAVVRFNRSLPCGAKLVRAEDTGDFTTATFRLTERPGPGVCGPGTGELAETAFKIEDGKIVDWRRQELGTPNAEGHAV
jgi:hypothetical protein